MDEGIRLKSLTMDNFMKFANKMTVEFSGRRLSLVGLNGSGKSSVLTGIWAAFKGVMEKGGNGQLIGQRSYFIGSKGKSADIELVLIDTRHNNAEIIVRNHITAGKNSISFTKPDDYPWDENWIGNLLSVVFMSAKQFCAQTGKEQALALGVDTSAFDARIKALKTDATVLNAQVKAFGAIEPIEKAEAVQTSEILKQIEAINAFNRKQDEAKQKIESLSGMKKLQTTTLEGIAGEKDQVQRQYEYEVAEAIKRRDSGLATLAKKETDLKERIKHVEIEILDIPELEPKKDIAELTEQLQNSETVNIQARKYSDFMKRSAEKQALQDKSKSNKEAQAKVADERVEFVKKFDFGVAGLSVDEDGGLLIGGRPFREPHFSTAEREIIVAQLHARNNPDFKVRFIDNWESIDKQNQEKLANHLLGKGFYIITAEVGSSAGEGENVLLLSEEESKEKLMV